MAAEACAANVWAPLGTLIGVVLGFGLSEARAYLLRKRKHPAMRRALWAEVRYAQGRAKAYVTDDIRAPLYRLPDAIYKACFPELMKDGVASPAECDALLAFYGELDTLNRGLERSAAAVSEDAKVTEFNRNKGKAARLIEDGPAFQAVKLALRPYSSE